MTTLIAGITLRRVWRKCVFIDRARGYENDGVTVISNYPLTAATGSTFQVIILDKMARALGIDCDARTQFFTSDSVLIEKLQVEDDMCRSSHFTSHSYSYFGLDYVFASNEYSKFLGYTWRGMTVDFVASLCIYDDRWFVQPYLDMILSNQGGIGRCSYADDLHNYRIAAMCSEAASDFLTNDQYEEREEIEYSDNFPGQSIPGVTEPSTLDEEVAEATWFQCKATFGTAYYDGSEDHWEVFKAVHGTRYDCAKYSNLKPVTVGQVTVQIKNAFIYGRGLVEQLPMVVKLVGSCGLVGASDPLMLDSSGQSMSVVTWLVEMAPWIVSVLIGVIGSYYLGYSHGRLSELAPMVHARNVSSDDKKIRGANLSLDRECALDGCSNGVFVEPNGRVHDYCCFTHSRQGSKAESPTGGSRTGPVVDEEKEEIPDQVEDGNVPPEDNLDKPWESSDGHVLTVKMDRALVTPMKGKTPGNSAAKCSYNFGFWKRYVQAGGNVSCRDHQYTYMGSAHNFKPRELDATLTEWMVNLSKLYWPTCKICFAPVPPDVVMKSNPVNAGSVYYACSCCDRSFNYWAGDYWAAAYRRFLASTSVRVHSSDKGSTYETNVEDVIHDSQISGDTTEDIREEVHELWKCAHEAFVETTSGVKNTSVIHHSRVKNGKGLMYLFTLFMCVSEVESMPIPENDGMLPMDEDHDSILWMFIGTCILFLILRSLVRLSSHFREPLFNICLSPTYRGLRACIAGGALFAATLELSHFIDYGVPVLVCGSYAFYAKTRLSKYMQPIFVCPQLIEV